MRIFNFRIKQASRNQPGVDIHLPKKAYKLFRLIASHRLLSLLFVVLILASLIIPVAEQTFTSSRYKLSAKVGELLGSTSPKLAGKITYDTQKELYQFNKEAQKTQGGGEPSVQAGNKGYSADLPKDPSKGITLYDTVNNLSISFTPEFKTLEAKQDTNRFIYPINSNPGQMVYTVKANGIKEDLILTKPGKDNLDFSYKLNLNSDLEARLTSDGGVGVYSADPTLFGNISFGSDADQQKVEAARKNGKKTNLVFEIPSPIIKQSGSANENCKLQTENCPSAQFELKDNILTVKASKLKGASYPLSIDPTFIVTSASDWAKGNFEGGAETSGNDLIRSGLTGGTVGSWTQQTGQLPANRLNFPSIVYNGFIYITGGITVLSGSSTTGAKTVYSAQINSDGSVGTFNTSNPDIPVDRYKHSGAAYNGYLYILGGSTAANDFNSDVLYAKIKSDGTVGSWSATTSYTTARTDQSAIVNNGYLYVMGGCSHVVLITGNCDATLNDVQYAKINGDGTLESSWHSANSFTTARRAHNAVSYNGYLYIIGGIDAGNATLTNIQYAKANDDGTTGAWATAGAMLANRFFMSSWANNGYLHYAAGSTGSESSEVDYASFNSNGTISNFNKTTSITTARTRGGIVSYNNYLIFYGGTSGSTPNVVGYDDVQHAKIDPVGTVGTTNGTTFTDSGNSFTTARWGHGTAVYDGYVYIGGGCNNTSCKDSGSDGYLATIYFALINADGTLGTWTQTSSNIPASIGNKAGRFGASLVARDNWLYVVSGLGRTTLDAGVFLDTVVRAHIGTSGQIENNGTCSPWCTSSSNLSTARYFHQAVVWDDELFVVAGTTSGNFSTALSSVEHATFDSSGDLGSFSTTSSLGTARNRFASAIANGYLYAIGGYTGSSYLNTIERAKLNENGTLGSWTSTGNTAFTTARMGLTAYANKGKLYVVGGHDGTNFKSDVQSADIATDGTIGSWTTLTPTLATARWGQGAAQAGDYLYAVGGCSALTSGNCSTFLATTEYGAVNNGGIGGVGSWTTDTGGDFTTARAEHCTVILNGYIYVIGGNDGSAAINSVQYAPLNSDGSVGAWAANASLLSARSRHACATQNGYIYLAGGTGSSGISTNTFYAKPDASGVIPSSGSGAWTQDTGGDFTTGRIQFAAVAYNNFIYIIGGRNNGALGSAQYAPLNAVDGSVGAWSATSTNLTTARRGHAAVMVREYLYVLGGCTDDLADCADSAILSDVEYTKLAANGDVSSDSGCGSAWCNGASLPRPNWLMSAIAYNGEIYIPGGHESNTKVFHIPVSASGQLGSSWVRTSSLSAGKTAYGIASYNGYIYITGGDGPSAATVYTPIQSIPRIGKYSRLLDCEADCTPTKLLTRGTSAGLDSIVSNSYMCATNASPTFGSTTSYTVSLGSLVTIPYQLKRYCWLSYTLDDTFSAVFPDSSSIQTSLSDFNLYTITPHPVDA